MKGRLFRHLLRLLEADIAEVREHIAAVDERAAAREQANANNLADLTREVAEIRHQLRTRLGFDA